MLKAFLAFVLQQRLVVICLTVLLIGVGAWSALHLPIDAVPDITNIQVKINTNAPSLSPLEVE
jgi:heavy metal efflux system protein